jgi:apolipoprotein N-acyltransferase
MRSVAVANKGDVAMNLQVGKASILALALAGSAYLMALAIESPQYVWLGWVTLLPLFYAIRVLSPARAMISGAFWGACLFSISVSLANTTIKPTLDSLVLLSLVPGAYCSFGAAMTRRIGFSPYLLALGWIGVEIALRPLGMHCGLLAGTQGDSMVVRVVGSFAGYVLVAFLVAYFNAALLSAIAEVYVPAGSRRLPLRGASPIRKIFINDSVIQLLDLIRIGRPRGPPLTALATLERTR